ncbi:MAG: di-trans,poly-cis-decaprenylcistransferase [Bdellovibrio sp.]|nr:di-trans,poly-cis-decaprenylcistransferase [Bdellovibrio sp.]
MDGNGRWAQAKGYPRVFGHIRGATRVRPIVREADNLGIKALTLYAFSTENWSRPESELNILWKLLKKYFQKELNELKQKNIRLNIIGELERLPLAIQETVSPMLRELSENTGLQFNLAISYGSRREISQAASYFAKDCLTGIHQPQDMTEELFLKYLTTNKLKELSDVDLVIRTSGEKRVSNFLLWQSAYAEYVFTDTYWPDYTPKHFREALFEYSQRERRYGKVKACNNELNTL